MMFGQHQDDQHVSDDQNSDNTIASTMPEPTADGLLSNDDSGPAPATDNTPPAVSPVAAPTPVATHDDTSSGYLASPGEPENNRPATTVADDNLLQLKQDALQQLSPLLGHLDQTPEEKFRTTMMMIQASDNQSLLQAAYEAARQIPDEKVRAQALLDVVNEINYFTQHNES